MDTNAHLESPNDIPIEFLPDFQISFTEKELDDLDMELSVKENELLNELTELKDNLHRNHDVLRDILEASKKGAMDYLNSFTDTSDTISELKNPENVRSTESAYIDKKCKPTTNQEKMNNWQTRPLRDANTNPFDNNSAATTSGMSKEGAARFERYKKVYSNRNKSIRNISSGSNTISYKTDESQNFESLAALRGYRIGPVVEMYSKSEIKNMYETKKEQSGAFDNVSNWLKDENYNKFDDHLVEEFGFKNRAEAATWRRENNLTIHEGPDGMFLVPSDVHDAVSHSGYRSEMQKYLNGKISDEELHRWEIKEKQQYIKHEVSVRGVRVVKGIGISVIKDVLKSSIAIIVEETILEFKKDCKDKFVQRISRICKSCFEHIKSKCKDILANIWNNIKGSFVAEAMNFLVDMLKNFIFSTAKNIIKIIRTMWGSIIKAGKIIFSKKSSWEDRIFEASKILTAGFVGVIGFSLNELLEKGLTAIGIPFASFISECLSGLFASIMSALVFMLFDNIKSQFKSQSVYTKQSMLEAQILCVNSVRIDISTLKTNMAVSDAFQFVSERIRQMQIDSEHSVEQINRSKKMNEEIAKQLHNNQQKNIKAMEELSKYKEDNNF